MSWLKGVGEWLWRGCIGGCSYLVLCLSCWRLGIGWVIPAVCVATGSGDRLPEKSETEGAVKILCLHCFWINVPVFLKTSRHCYWHPFSWTIWDHELGHFWWRTRLLPVCASSLFPPQSHCRSCQGPRRGAGSSRSAFSCSTSTSWSWSWSPPPHFHSHCLFPHQPVRKRVVRWSEILLILKLKAWISYKTLKLFC